MDMGEGEKGKGEMYGESNMEIYITICKIDSQWEFAICLRTPCQPGGVGWGGRWEGGLRGRGHRVHLWVIHADIWQKTTKFCKAIVLQ